MALVEISQNQIFFGRRPDQIVIITFAWSFSVLRNRIEPRTIVVSRFMLCLTFWSKSFLHSLLDFFDNFISLRVLRIQLSIITVPWRWPLTLRLFIGRHAWLIIDILLLIEIISLAEWVVWIFYILQIASISETVGKTVIITVIEWRFDSIQVLVNPRTLWRTIVVEFIALVSLMFLSGVLSFCLFLSIGWWRTIMIRKLFSWYLSGYTFFRYLGERVAFYEFSMLIRSFWIFFSLLFNKVFFDFWNLCAESFLNIIKFESKIWFSNFTEKACSSEIFIGFINTVWLTSWTELIRLAMKKRGLIMTSVMIWALLDGFFKNIFQVLILFDIHFFGNRFSRKLA